VFSSKLTNTRIKMDSADDEMRESQTVNTEEYFEAACEVATHAGKVNHAEVYHAAEGHCLNSLTVLTGNCNHLLQKFQQDVFDILFLQRDVTSVVFTTLIPCTSRQ